jgi:hypothetical protein
MPMPLALSALLLHMDTRSNATQISGAINGVFQAGCLIGALACIPIADNHGRRMAVSIAGMLAVLGGALQAASVHIVMYLVMRVVSGLGVGMMSFYVHAASRQNTNCINIRCFGYNGTFVSRRGSRPRDSRPRRRHHWYHDCSWLYKRKLDWLRLLLCSCFQRPMAHPHRHSMHPSSDLGHWSVVAP